jgi:hypothetical protein
VLVKLRGLAVLATVLITLLTTPVVAATPFGTALSVLQLNICHSGIADCYTGDAVLTKAVEVIADLRPTVLSVNEACEGDVSPLRAAFGPAATMFVAAEHDDGSPVTCTNGESFGNVVMVAAALAGGPGDSGHYTEQDTENEHRGWACLPAGKLTACTTHLSSHGPDIALAECKELMSRVAPLRRAAPIVVAGDLNLRHAGSPNVQACNLPYFYRKGDGAVQHVFASTDLSFVAVAAIPMSGTTDHPALLLSLTSARI